MIEIRDVTVRYGRTVALRSITLEIPTGICGLFGPNGSGKSTLLRAVAGLIRPTLGSIWYDGTKVDLRREDLRGRISYAGHETGLYPSLTLRENLELFARLYGVNSERKDAVVDLLGMHEREDVQIGDLSAGWKRRAAVARALLHDPELLLLDEPYANLDDEAAEVVTNAIKTWGRPGRSAIIATHGAKRLKPFVDASMVLQRGRAASFRMRAGEEVDA